VGQRGKAEGMRRRFPRRLMVGAGAAVIAAALGGGALIMSDQSSRDTAKPSARAASLIAPKMEGATEEEHAAFRASAAGAEPPKRAKDPEKNVHHDVSVPLREIAARPAPEKKQKQPKVDHPLPLPQAGPSEDPVVQTVEGQAAAPALGVSFEGLGQGFSGPAGTFFVNAAPPDTNGAVGPNRYVQIVNESFAVFDKSGTPVYGPVPTNTLWSGFGGGCQSNDDGDATVVYDRLADRWVFQQFSVSTTPFLECVAVSTSGDPTGSYYRYSFQYSNFPDYPKLGVWPDAYYLTLNLFNASGTAFLGPEMCAWNRAKMLAGQPATQQCFTLGSSDGGLLPADLDGATPPPAGAPNPMVEFGTNDLLLWRFHVDWTTPANSTFTGPTTLPVAAFTPACTTGGACIVQPSTTQKLDSLGDRVMYRLAYRNFGDHDSLVVNHSVNAGSSVGVRWYELRNPNSATTVYQQGTYAPDATYRWMGSAAMDGAGNIGLGFSTSSSTARPGVHYTAHLVSDPSGVMGQGEGVVINGAGSQTGGLNRWGDYSSLNVDPTDDCTFWFTSEYLASSGSFNWHTRVGTFKLAGCGSVSTPDFSLAATPSSQTVNSGQGTTYDVTITPSGGFSAGVNLSVSGLPAGATGTFSPNPATSSSTLSVSTTASTPAGTYALTIAGTGGGQTHQTSATLVVQAAAAPDFTLSASPASQTINRGGSTTYVVTVTAINGFSGLVTLSVSGLPRRSSPSFSPNPTKSTSTLTIKSKQAVSPGTYPVTITGKNNGLTHTTSVTLVIQ
jgi:hypothetical protein